MERTIGYYIGKFVAQTLCFMGKHRPIRAPFMYPEDLICLFCWGYLGIDNDLRESHPHSSMGLPMGEFIWRGGKYMIPQPMESHNID